MLTITASKSTGTAKQILRTLTPGAFKPVTSWHDLNDVKLLSDEQRGVTLTQIDSKRAYQKLIGRAGAGQQRQITTPLTSREV